ncbi:MAG: cytochrome P450 [Dehalococcoidia bacterium]
MVTGLNPLTSPAAQDNPYPYYAMARQFMPVLFMDQQKVWSVFSYEDCRNILRDPKRYSSDFQRIMPVEQRQRPSMLNADPPLHTRLRELVNRAFTPRMVAQLEPRIRAITDDLLTAALPAGRIDLVPDFAVPLPVIVIAEILGIPPADRDLFKRWSNEIAASLGVDISMDSPGVSQGTIDELSQYFTRIIDQRRAEPREDLISALLRTRLDGEKLSVDDLLNFCILLLVAGNETTTNLIGNAVRTLLEHPADFERLRAEPSLWPSAVEEVLRYRPPVQATIRLTTEDVELHGTAVAANQPVVVWLASANRDPAEFAEPDRFDIARSPNRHLSFGQGIHFCLGAPLARLETAIALQEVGRRLPNLRLDGAPAWEQVPGFIMHGVRHLPLLFGR